MINGLRSEFYKLFYSRIFWILILICALFSLFVTGLLFFEEKGWIIESITIEANIEGNEEMAKNELQGFSVLIQSISAPDSFFLYLFAALLGAFFLAGEYSNGTIKNIVSIGYKRHVLYLTKVIVVWTGTIAIYVFMTVIFAVFTSLFFGLGPMPSSEVWIEALRIFGFTCLLIGGFVAITILISMSASNSATALFAAIGFYLIFVTAFGMLAQQYTFFAQIQQYSIFNYMDNLPLDVSSTGKFMRSLIGVTLCTIIAFISGGIALFHKRDIT